MVGASLMLATVRSNAGRLVLTSPSETEIAIPLVMPTSAFSGVPDSLPVLVSKASQAGALVTEKDSVVPRSISVAVGLKL